MTGTPLSPHTHHAVGQKSAFLKTAPPTAISLRDGEVVIYRRTRSLLYQCRYKLTDGTWYRQTTGKASLEHAIAIAVDAATHVLFDTSLCPRLSRQISAG